MLQATGLPRAWSPSCGTSGSASTQVLSAAQSLCAESNRLKLEAGRFLDSVRAAWLLK